MSTVSRLALFALSFAFGSLLLSSCDNEAMEAARVTSKADRNDVTVSVVWLSAAKVDEVCKSAGAKDGMHFEACAASGPTACTIYAVEPRHFGDRPGLQALGHEAWHCFGARH